MSTPTSRQAFEDLIWQFYQAKKAHGFSRPDEGDPNNRESLFWKAEDGSYGVRQIEAAWQGWQLAKADSHVMLTSLYEMHREHVL
jgi:hypothetical protein